MKFSADHYFRASVDRMSQAHFLYRAGQGHFALAMYAAGLAVECLLRANMMRRKPDFESRHDLLLLLKESGMLDINSDRMRAKKFTDEQIEEHRAVLRSLANDVFILWRNEYRFASDARLLAHLKKMKLQRGSKGDLLKAKAHELLNAAQGFIDRGVLQWQ